jgi:hypothetical protein
VRPKPVRGLSLDGGTLATHGFQGSKAQDPPV